MKSLLARVFTILMNRHVRAVGLILVVALGTVAYATPKAYASTSFTASNVTLDPLSNLLELDVTGSALGSALDYSITDTSGNYYWYPSNAVTCQLITGSTYHCNTTVFPVRNDAGLSTVQIRSTAQTGGSVSQNLSYPLPLPSSWTSAHPSAGGAWVGTDLLTNLGVTTGKLADSAVTTAKIADGSVTTAKLASGVVPTDGWTSSGDTWTYASANSFTISGVDRTSIYKTGTRIKATNNSSTYYGVVATSSFSTNTTVTLAANSDYSLSNSAITSNFYSYEQSPAGYPTWFHYTPTITGVTSPFSFAEFKLDGTACSVNWQQVGGSSNAASFTATLPITPTGSLTGGYDVYVATVQDNTTWQNSPGVVGIVANTQAASIGKTISSQSGNAFAGFTSSGQKVTTAQFTYPIQ